MLLAVPSFMGNPTDVRQWAEWLCYAMVAVGLDIAWGYGGMLCLGQGLFFGLGAYAMGMHLSLENVPKGSLPSFMSLYSDYTELPLLWRPFQSFWFTAFAAVIVPDDRGRRCSACSSSSAASGARSSPSSPRPRR